MSRVNEIKGYIREQQAKRKHLGSNDKILLELMMDELKQEHGIETIVEKGTKVRFHLLEASPQNITNNS